MAKITYIEHGTEKKHEIEVETIIVSGNPDNMPGGITIWDITEPTEPKQLVRAFVVALAQGKKQARNRPKLLSSGRPE